MNTDPFPEVHARLEIDSLPSRRWIECVACVEHKALDDGSNGEEFAREHLAERPWHTRYRIVSQVGFRFVPTVEPATA
ncbi:hypothetical protein ACFVRU_03635 [Streptomyces sp. NPDC057927]